MRAKGRMLDGNGRTGRLPLNWQRRSTGFPLTMIQVEERARSSAVWIWRRVENEAGLGRSGNLPSLRMRVGPLPRSGALRQRQPLFLSPLPSAS